VSRRREFEPSFVEFIPVTLDEGVLYVSMEYTTVVHLCACGCASKVVNPLSRAQWQLTYDGTVSLYPSIGNWDLPCGSHYWIENNRVDWSRPWSKAQVESGRKRDQIALEAQYEPPAAVKEPDAAKPPYWSLLRRVLRRLSQWNKRRRTQ
jgi:hypothetical protein